MLRLYWEAGRSRFPGSDADIVALNTSGSGPRWTGEACTLSRTIDEFQELVNTELHLVDAIHLKKGSGEVGEP